MLHSERLFFLKRMYTDCMNNAVHYTIITILALIVVILISMLILYRRQVQSICRQLRMHRLDSSNIDYRTDVIGGPFRELQMELNLCEREKREKNRRYKEQEDAWKQLVSNVSHDIRTPITSVSGYFQLLLETEDEEKKKQYSDIIMSRLQRFKEMLEDFFAYSTVVSTDRRIETERFDAVRVVTETLFMYCREIEEHFGTPIIDVPSQAFCYANSKELARVVQNIVKNALIHGRNSLRVRICVTDKVDIFFENEADAEVTEEDLRRVFDRTYRMDASRNSMGTGLGLCIVKELVLQMSGQVEAYLSDDRYFGIHISLMKG